MRNLSKFTLKFAFLANLIASNVQKLLIVFATSFGKTMIEELHFIVKTSKIQCIISE